MPESTDTNKPDLNATVSVKKIWLDTLISELQSKIGAKEVENSALRVDLEIARAEQAELQGRIDELVRKVSNDDTEQKDGTSDSED